MSILALCASCGGSTASTEIGVATSAARVVSGDGWSLEMPGDLLERLPESFDAWFERADGSTVVTVEVYRGAESDSLEVDRVVSVWVEHYETQGAVCEVVSEEPVAGLAARRLRCRGVDLLAPDEDGEALDRLEMVIVARRNWAYAFECFDRTGDCESVLETARVAASIEPAGRTPRASLTHSLSYRPAFPFDSGLPGGDAPRVRVSAEGASGRGATRPLVTIVEFTDLQCPFCQRVEPTLARLLERYPNDVRIVVRHNPLPFHENAPLAAEALEEARDQGGDPAFFRLLDAIFRAPAGWGRTEILELATHVGLDAQAMASALDERRHRRRIEADEALADRVGANGTPSFFINGRAFIGAQPYEAFAAVVEEEIALARRAVEEGVARERIYEAALANALEEMPPQPTNNARERPDPSLVYNVPADSFPTRGPRDALVTIVEFTDFECPFCGRVNPTLDQLLAEYGNDLRVVVRNNPLPFHQHAQLAAEAALEAYAQGGDAAHARYYALLFANQDALARRDLEQHASDIGLDLGRFRRALDRHIHAAAVSADSELTRRLGAGGTPTFFINGHSLRGAQPLSAFKAVVDRELAEARALVASGVPRGSVYARIISDGLTSAPPARDAAPTDEPAPAFYEPVFTFRAPSRGVASAPIVIKLFTDFQCPFCNRISPTLDRLLEVYAGRVRLEYHAYPLPFHTHAMFAAQIGREVFEQRGDEAFWRYYHAVFEAQRDLDRDRIVQIARAIPGIDRNRLARAVSADAHLGTIQSEIDIVQAIGMQIGTPSVLIDGQLVQGAVSYETFVEVIDARIAARARPPTARP